MNPSLWYETVLSCRLLGFDLLALNGSIVPTCWNRVYYTSS